ncbi:hypothetical protein HanPI659440_Chr16g0641421 [Helianthus annuus]|nr:hypothetical protein HanPI659440_Chr16g0641421 [Helianthus annuus]
MPESRDRLSRPNNDIAEMYSRRQMAVERSVSRTPFRWGATPLTGDGSGQRIGEAFGTTTAIRGGGSGRGLFGTPVTVNRRGGQSQTTPPAGSVRRGRGGHTLVFYLLGIHALLLMISLMPFGYDAVERRREHLGDGEGSTLGSPIPTNQTAGRQQSLSGVQLEHEVSVVTPKPKLAYKTYKPSTLGNIPIMLTTIANKVEGDSELLTPQKKLLDSIDLVEMVVMEELKRLRRTPAAKKAEWEKKVRTLMSMR